MKSLQAPNLKTIALTKAMYTAVLCNDEQAFSNVSEESGKKKNFMVKKSLRPVSSQGKGEQAKTYGSFRPQQDYPGNALRPHRER